MELLTIEKNQIEKRASCWFMLYGFIFLVRAQSNHQNETSPFIMLIFREMYWPENDQNSNRNTRPSNLN